MQKRIAAVLFALVSPHLATAQTNIYETGYRVCAPEAAATGRDVVRETCGALESPDFSELSITSMQDLRAYKAQREAFRGEVKTYGACITQLINSYRRPGAPADSIVPDQAACAHSWAEDQATALVRDFGRACINYSNQTMMDPGLSDYDGADCYLTGLADQG